MQYRTFGRTGWSVSEIGYGMWGLAGGRVRRTRRRWPSLERAVQLGCNFFDTAWAYGDGRSEQMLGHLVHNHPENELYVATKLPPKNRTWPSQRGFTLDECFPPDYIHEYAEKSLRNLELTRIDLLQFHVWEDSWAHDERWQRAIDELKRQALVRAVGISVNRWEPDNVIETLKTGLIDAVQVIYNIFDQAPQDDALAALPRAEHRRDRAGAIRRGDAHRHADKGIALARGRLAEQLFRPGEPRGERRPRRGPAAAGPSGHLDGRAGPALDPCRSDGVRP